MARPSAPPRSAPHFPVVAMTTHNLDEALRTCGDNAQPARVYDYLLHGATNCHADQRFADEQLARWPNLALIAGSNRDWVFRVICYLLDLRIRQFLDIGCGLPTDIHNVHELCERRAAGQNRVVYVDNDWLATDYAVLRLEHAKLLGRHSVIRGDLRDPGRMWQQALDHELIDPDQPVGIILAAVLHFVPDDVAADQLTPSEAVAFLRDHSAPGSALAISHATLDGLYGLDRAAFSAVAHAYHAQSIASTQLRGREEIDAFFGDWSLVNPGLAWTAQWWPSDVHEPLIGSPLDDPSRSRMLAGVARHPGRTTHSHSPVTPAPPDARHAITIDQPATALGAERLMGVAS